MLNEQTMIWHPSCEQIEHANVTAMMRDLNVSCYDDLYSLSIEQPQRYWTAVLDRAGVQWSRPFDTLVDTSRGREFPEWFAGSRLNWVDTLFRWAKDNATATRTAVVAEGEDGQLRSLTYRELHDKVRAFAGGLKTLGIQRGDRVAMLMEPGIEAVASLLAINYIGAVFMPLFSGFGVDPIVSRLTSCGARALITTTGFQRRGKWIDRTNVAAEAARRSGTEFLIVKAAEGQVPAGAIDWFAVAAGEPLGTAAEPMSSDDPMMVLYTSGTTGSPKGIVHTHSGFPIKIAHDAMVHFDVKEEDVFFWPADMGWIAGALVVAAALTHGATMLCYDGAPNFPNWSRMAQLIARHKVTHFGSPPTMIRGFAANREAIDGADLSSLRLLITGGEAIDADHFIWHQRYFGGGVAPLINYSGGTEASGCLVSSVIVKPIVPCGFNTASPGILVDVVDASGASLIGTLGELVVREPFVGMTRSFWDDDCRYLETYWRSIPGLWVQGDLAERDKDGNFFIRGRSDDTLKLAGKRTGPAEIEDVLMQVAGVAEVAAIGVDDPAKGQVLVVFAVVAAVEVNVAEVVREIMAAADRRLGSAFRPSKVHLVPELPKTRTGKVMRRLIRNAYCGQPFGDLSSCENPASLELISLARA